MWSKLSCQDPHQRSGAVTPASQSIQQRPEKSQSSRAICKLTHQSCLCLAITSLQLPSMAANGFRADDKQKIGDGFVGPVTWQQDSVVLGGPAGEFPANIFETAQILYQKKSLTQQQQQNKRTTD